jgi:hypothetical protein
MRYLSKYLLLSLFTIMLLAVTACDNNREPEEVRVRKPTPELAVVVFATEAPAEEEPTPTAVATQSAQAEPEPAAVATVGVGVSAAVSEQSDDVQETTTIISFPTERPPDVNPLTGLKVADQAVLQRRPLMVRVGNDPGARPQVALNEADMVYEEIVEWWVTRFTAIYLSQDPDTIAPIRSARLINLHLTAQYQGALANSGGSDGVRWELSQTDIVNLDEFFAPRPYFYRPNEGWQTRLAIDATAARDYLAGEELEGNANLRGFFFSEQPDLSVVPPGAIADALNVTIPYPQQTSATRWEFDQSSGTYLRFINDQQLLGFNGNPISAANVIIYFADHQPTDIVEDSNGATSIRIIINGRGPAWILRDGKIARGTWQTNGRETPLFVFDNGQPMPLKPGNTWVQVVPLTYALEIDGISYDLEGSSAPGQSEPPVEQQGEDEPTPTLTPIGAQPQATAESQ